MASKTTIINAEMKCSGCTGAVTRLLKNVDGVIDVSPSLETQKVTISHNDAVDGEKLLGALKDWATAGGKKLA